MDPWGNPVVVPQQQQQRPQPPQQSSWGAFDGGFQSAAPAQTPGYQQQARVRFFSLPAFRSNTPDPDRPVSDAAFVGFQHGTSGSERLGSGSCSGSRRRE